MGAISREREERRHIRDKEYYQQRQEDEKKELSRLLSEEVLANEERKDGIQEIDEKLQKDIDDKRVLLGGCSILKNSPKWFCSNCQTEYFLEKD